MLALWLMVQGCGGGGTNVPFECPETSALQVVDPRWGGRTAWCARRNETRHGPWMEWRDDGSLSKSSHYHNNRRSGEYRLWYPSGQLMEEATYQEGKLHGGRTLYEEDGSVKAKERWEAGEQLSNAE